jgi:hypothetical protein
MKNTISDTYLEHELEKALMNERDRNLLFQFENVVIEFLEDKGIYWPSL